MAKQESSLGLLPILFLMSLLINNPCQANTWGTSVSSYSIGIQGHTHKVLCTLSCLYSSSGNSFKLLHKGDGKHIIYNKSCKNSSIPTEIIENWAYAKPYREHSRKTQHAAVEVAVWLWCNACELTLSNLFHYTYVTYKYLILCLTGMFVD